MVLLGRMHMTAVACMAMVLACPVTSLGETERDNAELVRDVLETSTDKIQADLERERAVRGQAEGGDAEAQHELGALLAVGRGNPQSYAEAAQWFQRAAEQGHSGAQYWLGNLYMRGAGVPQDQHRMMQWWHKAAVQGNVNAQYALGSAYRDGDMIKPDAARANAWFFMASSNTGAINTRRKPKAMAKPAPASAEALAEELRARRMESYENDRREGGR